MKVLIFLYPIKDFFLMYLWIMLRRVYPKPQINKIVDLYRKNDYKIVWLFFAEKFDKTKPDVKMKSRQIKILPNDLVISAGITLNELCSGKYAEEKSIFNHIYSYTGKIQKLVIGGFHEDDCVKKIADYASNIGINAKIDQNLTEKFYYQKIQ